MQAGHINNYNDIIFTFIMGVIFVVFGVKFLIGRKKILDALLGLKTRSGSPMNENTVRMVSGLLIPFVGVIITMGGGIQIVQAIIALINIAR